MVLSANWVLSTSTDVLMARGAASGSIQWLGVAIFGSVILIEFLFSLKYEPQLYSKKDSLASITMGVGAYIMAFFLSKLFGLYLFVNVYEFFNPIVTAVNAPAGMDMSVDANGIQYAIEKVNGVDVKYVYRESIFGWSPFSMKWYFFLICQICDDFNYYWHHRFSHTIRILWAAHIVHHSSDNYNMATAVRNGWVTIFYKPIWWIWVPMIGFHPFMVTTCLIIQAVWQFQLHTKFIKTLGPFNWIMNTHTMHQAHHAQNVEYMDKNHGGYLNIFDKIFGTWTNLDPKVDIQYGVTTPPKTNNPLDIVSHEYVNIIRDVKKAKSIKEGLMYIFGPPGWSPDGSSKTVRQLQRELKNQEKGKKKEKDSEGVLA